MALCGIALLGCAKPYFMTQVDYDFYNRISGEFERAKYEEQPIVPEGEPRTVREPGDRKRWELTLAEAKRIALEHNKQIAVVQYVPGDAGTQIDFQLASFDAFFEAGGGWGRQEQQVVNRVQVVGTGRDAIIQKLFGSSIPLPGSAFGVATTSGANTGVIPLNSTVRNAGFSNPGAGVVGQPLNMLGFGKRLATGGIARVNYSLGYNNINPVNVFTAVNPAWQSSVNLTMQQPILQGAGVEFNRAPILIARAIYEQTLKDFQTQVNTLLRDVEIAYWQLTFTYYDLDSRQKGMEQALATWQKEKNKFEVGTGSKPDVAQAREQFEFFRAARLQALTRVLAAERDLRRVMGLPPDDDRQIVTKDQPLIAEYAPHWQAGVLEAMELRPELAAERFVIRALELQVLQAKNGLLPDLTANGTYSVTGLDNQWDKSIDVLTDNRYTTWTLGFRYTQQIGERSAHAEVRRAQLALGRGRANLRNLEHTYICDLHEAYQNVISNYELIQVQKDRREAAAQQLQAREQFYKQGKTTIDVLLQAQTTFADALRDEAQAIVNYNQSIIRWEFVRGTIVQTDNVVIAEEQINRMRPKTAQERIDQWIHSLPVPMHPGDHVHGDLIWSPDNTGPLYPNAILEPAEAPTSTPTPSGPGAGPAPEAPSNSGEPSSPRPGATTPPPRSSTGSPILELKSPPSSESSIPKAPTR